jgi:hypothetical protein
MQTVYTATFAFFAVLRIYLPEPQVRLGQWKGPPMQRVE